MDGWMVCCDFWEREGGRGGGWGGEGRLYTRDLVLI